MSDLNPFAPPAVDEPRLNHAIDSPGVRFFLVSRTKFVIMSLLTFGLYDVYWFYKHRQQTKIRTRSDIWPLPRAIFALFFTHALLRDVRLAAAEIGIAPRFGVQSSAWGFIILTLLSRLPDPYWLISVIAFVPLIPVQDTINDIHRQIAPTADENASFTLGNWVTIVICLALWLLGIAAVVFLQETLSP